MTLLEILKKNISLYIFIITYLFKFVKTQENTEVKSFSNTLYPSILSLLIFKALININKY